MNDPSLYNDDLAPVPQAKRTWKLWNVAALWVGMAICVPTYTLASERVAGGMSAWQAVLVIALANLIVLLPLMANGHPGTKYGIPFPVVVRASFGVKGAQLPAVLRALVACGWFGIQCWFGGLGLWATASALLPSVTLPDVTVLGAPLGQLVWFFVFWAINVFFIWRGMESIKWLETLAAPFLLVCGAALLVWAMVKGGGLGNVMSQPATKPLSETFAVALTSGVSFWATLALNIPDFSRFARSQRDQALGQAIAMPTTMTLFAFVGVATTAATVVVFGDALVYPDQLVVKFENPFIIGISMLGLAIATLSTNIAANVVSPANDFANLAPAKVSYRMGGVITAVIGVLICPWLILKSAGNYIFVWLVGYGVLLGPVGAIMIVDYFVLRRTKLEVDDLYRRGGRYEYTRGVNWRAMVAFAAGVLPCLPGFIVAASGMEPESVPALFNHLYTWAWFVSSGISGVAYGLLMPKRLVA
ncbi:MAG: NCS1 family nucleobase:cation symporter-1 [Polyangiaceae bacterium]|nr:NCS1 family nucleobase:cation symporter-1 [Polyangiaceae bacterium]